MEDPEWVIMGGSRLGHHGRIQGGSTWGDSGWGHHGRIQDGSSLVNNGQIQGASPWGYPSWLTIGI